MRERKFRAWSIEKQSWVYFGIDNVPSWVHPAEVYDYTGLKDRNGKEIYEGDILKNKHKDIWVVVWEGMGFKTALYGKAVYTANEYWFGSCDVIGNIYENPELLEGEV